MNTHIVWTIYYIIVALYAISVVGGLFCIYRYVRKLEQQTKKTLDRSD